MDPSRPSATALLVARSLVFLSRDPDCSRLIPAAAAEFGGRLLRRFTGGSRLLRRLGRSWFRRLVLTAERLTVPGMMLHYAVRKHWLEDVARAALDDGVAQVVALGAGLDALAERLARAHPDCRFLEVGLPATQDLKRRLLCEVGAIPENLSLLPLDLHADAPERVLLRSEGFRPRADTLFLAEGVLMYLDAAAVSRLFRFSRQHGGARPRIAFTFMEPQPGGRIAFARQSRVVDLWLRLRGEPFRWGIRREELPGFLGGVGFTCRQLATTEELRATYLTSPELASLSLADGDHGCLASTSL